MPPTSQDTSFQGLKKHKIPLDNGSHNARANPPSATWTGEEMGTEIGGKKSWGTRTTSTSRSKAPRNIEQTTIRKAPRLREEANQMATIKLNASFVAAGLSANEKQTVASPIKKSFMGKGKETEKVKEKKKREVPTIPVSGLQSAVWIKAYFGEVKNRSDSCALILDTGSGIIWVNKQVYQKALKKKNVSQAKSYSDKLFECKYADSPVKGELYKDTISFKDKSIFVEKHIFGIVDENTCHIAKKWRENTNISRQGVFGIGPSTVNKGRVLDVQGNVIQNELLPNLFDDMKKQKKISDKVFGLYFQLPGERESSGTSSSSASSGSDDTMEGELHIGAPNKNAYIEGSMKEIPRTLRGTSQRHYDIDLTLNYNGKILMNDKPGVIDSGSSLIMLPKSVLDTYVENVGKHKDGSPIVTYDDKIGLYRIAKEDIEMLKDLEFDFVKGENAIFKLSSNAQIITPGLVEKNFP